MPNVLRFRGVDRLLADVCGMIADSFEMGRDEGEIEITPQVIWIVWHPSDQPSKRSRIHFIERFVAFSQ